MLGTYRDTDLDRRHPLSQALADLNREDAVHAHPAARPHARPRSASTSRRPPASTPSRALVHRVFEETEGNPFFLSEVVNLMTQEGTLARTSLADVAIPEGVQEALGPPPRPALRGGERAADDARGGGARVRPRAGRSALSAHDDETTLRAARGGARGARDRGDRRAGQYRFTHALMQETLLGELSAARQVRLHGRIAEALEALLRRDARDAPRGARAALRASQPC